ncbi:hypothetical protein AAVH_17685 [Aphelenchoides avenae]|nr:hypothetical protein AAVH_17685 [Aphelenchus avenae]
MLFDINFSRALVDLLRSVGATISEINEIRLSKASFRPNITLEMVLECFKNVNTVDLLPSGYVDDRTVFRTHISDDFIDTMREMRVSRLLLAQIDHVTERSVIDFCFPPEHEPAASRRRDLSLELSYTCPKMSRLFVCHLAEAARNSLHRNRLSLEVLNAGGQDVVGEPFKIVRVHNGWVSTDRGLLDFTLDGMRTQIFQCHEDVYLRRGEVSSTPASVFNDMETEKWCTV